MTKSNDNLRQIHFMPIGSIVSVQQEDKWPWMHGTIIQHSDANHNKSYKVQITQTGRIITGNAKHVKKTNITAYQCMLEQAQRQDSGV